MKALVVSSAAVLFCLLALIRCAIADGEGYYCDGPHPGCTQETCIDESGKCPVTNDDYLAVDTLSDPVYSCAPAMSAKCFMNYDDIFCTLSCYFHKDIMGCSDWQCFIGQSVNQCPH